MAHTDKSTPGPATARGFLRPKPPPGGRLPRRGRWLSEAETDEGTNPLLGEGGSAKPRRVWEQTLSWERVARRSRDGCGAVLGWTWYRPSSGPLRGVPFIRGFCGRRVVSPHPSGPEALPPSPWGKATSGGGCPEGKPSPYESVAGRSPDGCGRKTLSWETGVGRYEPGPGTAPLPAPGGPPSPRGR